MKKTFAFILATMLVGVLLLSACSKAPKEPFPNLKLSYTGTIQRINTLDENAMLDIADDNGTVVFVAIATPNTPVFADGKLSKYADTALSEGQRVEIYMAENAPMTASLPPQGSPDGIVLLDNN